MTNLSTGEINKFKEEDLYRPIADYFQNLGYEVRGENNYCDLTAMKGQELIIVELKKNLSVELLLQGTKRQKIADLVYIAIPKPKRMVLSKRWKDILHLLRRLELGLILVSFIKKEAIIEVPLNPEYFDREKSIRSARKKREKLISEFNGRSIDLNTGGSRGKRLVTSYREDSLYIACCINKIGPLSPKKLKELGSNMKKTHSILQKNHYNWFIREERGIYSLTPEGKESLKEYPKLASIYDEKIGGILNDKG